MAETTPNLTLPYILAGQALKHITHNEALRRLDAFVQLSVQSMTLATPPAAPSEGDRYIVAAGAAGSWTGADGQVAAFQDGAWALFPAVPGWRAWVAAEARLVVWDGGAWSDAASGLSSIENADHVGINTAADSTNRLAIAAQASLFTHDGADHRLKLNKAGVGDTVSLLYQAGYSGRAEIGLCGDDKLHFKTSADGMAWAEALTVDGQGNVGIGQTSPSAPLHVEGAVRPGTYSVASLPSASGLGAGALVYVDDESGGAVLAFSDGTDWRRVTDRAVVG